MGMLADRGSTRGAALGGIFDVDGEVSEEEECEVTGTRVKMTTRPLRYVIAAPGTWLGFGVRHIRSIARPDRRYLATRALSGHVLCQPGGFLGSGCWRG